MHIVLPDSCSSVFAGHQRVQLLSGAYSVRSLTAAETFHPVIGAAAAREAEEQLETHYAKMLAQMGSCTAIARPLFQYPNPVKRSSSPPAAYERTLLKLKADVMKADAQRENP